MKPKIIPKDKRDLQKLIEKEMIKNGNCCDLNHIDVTQIRDMAHLFENSFFNGDISKWNVSNVKTMYGMFAHSHFDSNISNWNVSNVEVMFAIFKNSSFTGDLSNWKPLNLKHIEDVFWRVKCPIPYWAKIKDEGERKKSIKVYELVTELNESLDINNSTSKKVKI